MTDDAPIAYGVGLQRSTDDAMDLRLEELEVLGFTIFQSGLDGAALSDIRERVDRLHATQSSGDTDHERGADSDVVRCPLAIDRAMLAIATLPPLVALAQRMLGPNIVLLQQNAIINRPQSPHVQSRWHRDLPYQHFVSSQPLAVNALLCIDDFTRETGGTLVLPGSHMFEAFPSNRFAAKHEVVAEAPAGSVIMMNAMLYHRAGANLSSGKRRGLNHLIGKPLLAQQLDIPRLLGGAHADDPFLSAYLGYRWNPAGDVDTWRSKHS